MIKGQTSESLQQPLKEGRPSSLLCQVSKDFTLFSTWESQAARKQDFPDLLGWGRPLFVAKAWGMSAGRCGSPLRTLRAGTLIHLHTPSTCAHPAHVSGMSICTLCETATISRVRKPPPCLSKQRRVRRISEQPSPAPTMSRVEAAMLRVLITGRRGS